MFLCWCAVYWHKVQELHEQTINHVLFVMKNWRMQSLKSYTDLVNILMLHAIYV